MLTTFVIALREGLEASLIVGIVAAFLRQQGRRDALTFMWSGVALAVLLCLAVGAVLTAIDRELPHRAQEGLETVVALVAVAMVTYMIVWMRTHARGLRAQLQADAAGALARGSAWALVGMAFLAVLREGFETAVFLLAAFQEATDPVPAGLGVLLGLAVAIALGVAIYRGGVRLDLGRFFRLTGLVLVLVAAGLFASAMHSGAEAGWVVAGQSEALDLSAVVEPGTVWASLVTGILGLQPEPTVIEVAAWLAYAVPMLIFVAAPDRVQASVRASALGVAAVAIPAVLVIGLAAGGDAASPAAQAAAGAGGARTVQVAVSDAGCEPARLALASGPVTFEVSSRGSGKVTEFEVVRDGRTQGEAENLVAGVGGKFSLTLQPGRYELRCPGGTRSADGVLVVSGPRRQPALAPELARGVDGYRRYLEANADQLVTRTARFTAALRAGDAARARALFAATRAPYERIEPVAESFGDLDPRIDARVNDVEQGTPWTGFHAIERRLWVGRTARGTAALADRLEADVRRLAGLVRTVELEPAQIANGATELLGEVAKSKVTGEEDRYSHTDLSDFQANVEGARAAYAAIAPVLRRREADLDAEIARRFAAVDAALRPYRSGAGFVPYTALERTEVRRLAQHIDALAEPLSRAPARALSA